MAKTALDEFLHDDEKAKDAHFLQKLALEYPESEFVQHAIVAAQKAAIE